MHATRHGYAGEPDRLRQVLTTALNDLGPVADVASIERAVKRVLPAAIPKPGAGDLDYPNSMSPRMS